MTESQHIPYSATTQLPAGPVLVLAPHPDDEVFGCGGAILNHRAAGQAVTVVILTDGGQGGDAAQRRLESQAAAQVLGYGAPEFWGLADRGLCYGEQLVQQLQHQIAACAAQVVYAPSPWEIHPDHLAVAYATLEAVRRQGDGIQLLLYEVGVPLRPNLLLDLTPYWAAKQLAMQCFGSQLARQAYDQHIAALNRYRTYTLPGSVLAAEAFYQLAAEAIGRHIWGLVEATATGSCRLPVLRVPLVSVIIRSMARPTLAQALASVALQTYANIEVVLVKAAGGEHPEPGRWCGRFPLRAVGDGQPLARVAAANLGLQSALGDYLLFLDDDDMLDASHLSALVAALQPQQRYGAAYAGVRAVAADGTPLGVIWHQTYDDLWLKYTNYLPIHAVLFRRELRDRGCAFDPQFDLYEDWDFWLQLAEQTEFMRIDQVSASYRAGGDSQGGAVRDAQARLADQAREQQMRARLYEKWRHRWSGETWNALLWHLDRHGDLDTLTQARDALQAQVQNLLAAQQATQQQQQQWLAWQQQETQLHQLQMQQLQDTHAQQLQQQNQQAARQLTALQTQQQAQQTALQQQMEAHQRRGIELERQLQHAWGKLDELVHSASWRLTRPYRWLGLRLKRWLGGTARVPVPAAVPAGSIRCQIEQPGAGEVVGSLLLQGWVHAPAGIKSLSLRIDDQDYPDWMTAIERPDVTALLGAMPDDIPAGFSQRIDLRHWPAGEHTLVLRVSTLQGAVHQETLKFWLADPADFYARWRDQRQMTPAERMKQHQAALQQAEPEWVNIWLVPGDEAALQATLESLVAQTYPYWQLNGLGFDPTPMAQALGIAAAQCEPSQVAVWSLFLEAGETLDPCLLAQALLDTTPDVDLYLFDYDVPVGPDGRRLPVLTPEWSPQFFLGYAYTGGVYLLRSTAVAASPQPGLAWRYDRLLQASDRVLKVRRLPQILWHANAASVSDAAAEAAHVEAALLRRNWAATVTRTPAGLRQVHYQLPESRPLVSIIIPTTGKLTHLKPCIESLLSRSTYHPVELILLDNGRGQYPEGIAYLRQRGLRVIECREAFNWSRLNNIGAQAAQGELLLFLNDDIEITQPDWLEALVALALRPEVGAVGALLRYPSGEIQHAGVFLVDHGGGARHLFQAQAVGEGYQHWDGVTREVSAVTGACLLVRRTCYAAVGGFDESLPIVGNDVDFCLKLRQQGHVNLYTPHAELIHHESISRKKLRIEQDEQRFWQRWGETLRQGDPYFNPNLAQDRTDCVLNSALPAAPLAAQGVNLIAYIRAEMGVGQGARSLASCLQAASVPFAVINFEAGNPARMNDRTWQAHEVLPAQAQFAVNILHVNADHTPFAVSQLPAELFAGRYTIGYWMWELPEFPDRWQESFRHVQEIWVGSSFVQQAIAAKSPVPVVRIPHAIALDLRTSPGRAHFGLPAQAFLFLSMYDTHSIVERKNPQGAILAFQRAFAPEDARVGLVLKVSNPQPAEMQVLRALLGNYRNIHVIEGTYSRSELNGLINACDCFVSLHRAEGFGLGPAEAMSLGKVALLTAWSGNTDYMRLDNCAPVGYRLVALGQDYGPYQAHQHWAEPDLEQAARWMRRLLEEPGLAQTLGARAQATIAEEFSPAVVGRLVAQRLQAIYSRLEH